MRSKGSVLFLSIALALTLTSCGSGQNAATRTITQVTDGVEETIDVEGNKIKIVNFLLVATEDGSAVVVGTIVNTGETEDQILGISVAGSQATLTGETILKTDKPIRFEGDSANAKAVFPAVGAKPGTNVDVTIGFARAGLVTVEAIIRDKRDDYANVTAD